MIRQIKVEPEHLILSAIALTFFTWFSVSAIFEGQIRMGRKLVGVSNIITRQDQPENYWCCTGFFLLLSVLGWFAVGLNAYRMMRERNRPQPKNDLSVEK